MKSFLIGFCFLALAPLSMAYTATDSCTGTTSCSLAGTHAATDIVIVWAYRAASATAPTLGSGFTNITNGSSATGANRSWRAGCIIAGTTGSISSQTWTNATNVVAFTISGTGATTTGNCATNGIGTIGTANNVSSATATYSALTMSASPTATSIPLLVMGSSTSGNTCTPTGATVINNTGDVRASLANATGNWSTTTCSITSSVTTEIVIELKAAQVATPTVDTNGGTFGTSASTTLSDSTSGSTICYTTDGSTPAASTAGTCSAGSTYSTALNITTSGTVVKALGTKSALSNSAVTTSSAFTINPFFPNLASMGVSGPGPFLDISIDNSWKGTSTTTGTSVNSAAVTTAGPNELLVAFSGADIQAFSSGGTTISVAGGGLTWHPVVNANGTGTGNGQFGMASVSWAYASSQVVAQAMTATLSAGTCACWIHVIAFKNASSSGIGASAIAGNTTGAPTKSVTTTAANSWVWGSVWDWSNNVTPVLGGSQTQRDIFNDSTNGDSGWTQYSTQPTAASGTVVTLNDTSPSTDNWSEVIVEILHQ